MRSTVSVAVMVAAAAMASPAGAVSVGEIDTFSGSIEAWFAGGGPMGATPPNSPRLESGGGPGGAADPYLRISANGNAGGEGSRLAAMNASQWAGDYLAAGITAIEMDVNNFGPSDITLRLLFEDPTTGPPLNVAATTFGEVLPANSGWRRVQFAIAPGDLTAVDGNATAALTGTTILRLFHNGTANFPPNPIAADLGVDNISAVPEPAAMTSMLAGLGLLGVSTWIRRRRKVA